MPGTRLKLVVAYVGTPFRGWQSQAGGNTVQDHLEKALTAICGTKIQVHGAGRTDAGVHAMAQCAHADVSRALGDWPRALNACLPPEIRVMRCSRVAPEFHARFSAIGKIYAYRIWNAPVQLPFERERSWHIHGPIDLALLRAAAEKLTGTHDFAAFAANRRNRVDSTVRTISRIAVQRKGPLIALTFEGNGFLYKMVRLLTGSLIRCAQGAAPLSWLDQLLDRETKTSFAAPAHGLFLKKVVYPATRKQSVKRIGLSAPAELA